MLSKSPLEIASLGQRQSGLLIGNTKLPLRKDIVGCDYEHRHTLSH
jgi:hypothetical protein